MFSNTANSSASDNVNTRPRLKAYLNFIRKTKLNGHKLALIAGYALTAGLFFGLGRFAYQPNPPDIKIDEPAIDLSKLNLTPNSADSQQVAGAAAETADQNCAGKIKGNVSSSGKIYHMPGGSFYNRTVPELCFDTEAEAQAAGFRRSQK